MIINHNMASSNALRQMNVNESNSSKSLQKLSSGLRINGAADDAAGLAISEKMRSQIRGLDQSSRNAQDGISLVQTAEGALGVSHNVLQRLRELADQSANGTNTEDDRKAMQTEASQLIKEIDRIGNDTEFNTKKLLNGSLQSSGGVVGANSTTGTAVAKLTAGISAVGTSFGAGKMVDGDFIEETVNIDGTDIKVNWANLSADDKSYLKAVATSGGSLVDVARTTKIFTDTINAAIDASGQNVAHISGYSDTDNGIILQSGSKGIDSGITTTAVGGVLAKVFGAGAGTIGTSTYNGSAISATEVADLTVNGVLLAITLDVAAATGGDMSAVATALADAINDAIDTANAASGKQDGEEGFLKDVSVTVTNDGKLSISSDSGPVTLANRAGKTGVTDLGLSQAQTDAAGSGGMTFQIGANKGQQITFGVKDMRSAALGISGLDVSTQTGAASALTKLDAAIKAVSGERSNLGAVQNRLEHTINSLGTSSENLTAAESRVRDVDMAKEMTLFKKNDILNQAAQAMLAQANQQPQAVLQLLR